MKEELGNRIVEGSLTREGNRVDLHRGGMDVTIAVIAVVDMKRYLMNECG